MVVKFNDFIKRFITTIITVGLISFLLLFSNNFLVSILIYLTVAILALIANWELLGMMVKKQKNLRILPVLIFSVIFILFTYFSLNFASYGIIYFLLLFLLFTCVLFLIYFKSPNGSVESITFSLFSVVYVTLPFCLFLYLLFTPFLSHGKFWFIYLLVVTKMTDIGGYFFGRIFGGKKLIPQISPGKTISGLFGGVACSLLASFLFFYFKDLSWLYSLYFGLIFSFLSILGDLSESLIKREAGVKDSNSIPGLGGVLDMVDSLLLTTPYLCIMLNL